MKKPTDHVAAGWNAEHALRWIEAGDLLFRESENPDGAMVEVFGPTWLSATQLAGLSRHLIGWFAGDLAEKICEIEDQTKVVKKKLEEWNDRARADEEHPPYDDLTRSLDVILAMCRDLREAPVIAAGKKLADEKEESLK
jgi:hypothetical protein